MNINGQNIFLGAYEERNSHCYTFNQQYFKEVISEEKLAENKAKIEEYTKSAEYKALKGDSVHVSISEETMNFLCSEEGFEKMKQDAAQMYIKQANMQRQFGADKDPNDPFWENTREQWMIFSEYLYNNDFYTNMSDEEVLEMEGMLAHITSGMNQISGIEYGMAPCTVMTSHTYNFNYAGGADGGFYMDSAEAIVELESSVNALKTFSEKYVSKDMQEEFNRLIDKYYEHNKGILADYHNPMESMNKFINGVYSGKYPDSALITEGRLPNISYEYVYKMILGGIHKTNEDKDVFANDVSSLFDSLRKKEIESAELWRQLQEMYMSYSTNDYQVTGLNEYVWDRMTDSLERMQGYWEKVLK